MKATKVGDIAGRNRYSLAFVVRDRQATTLSARAVSNSGSYIPITCILKENKEPGAIPNSLFSICSERRA